MSEPVRLVIFGKQGAGKGTQCEMLGERYGIAHISTGDMLRAAVAEGTDFGRQAKAYMDAGELLPDEIMIGVVRERLSKRDATEVGFMLDGFPRTSGQAEALAEILAPAELDRAISIEVPTELVLERMLERGRADDTEDAITRRLSLYETQTEPLKRWFDERGQLSTVDGVGTPEEVFARMTALVDERRAG